MEAVVQAMLEDRVLSAAKAAEDAVDDELHRLNNMTEACALRAGRGRLPRRRARMARAGRAGWRCGAAARRRRRGAGTGAHGGGLLTARAPARMTSRRCGANG
jgi:hypothetical protein